MIDFDKLKKGDVVYWRTKFNSGNWTCTKAVVEQLNPPQRKVLLCFPVVNERRWYKATDPSMEHFYPEGKLPKGYKP